MPLFSALYGIVREGHKGAGWPVYTQVKIKYRSYLGLSAEFSKS